MTVDLAEYPDGCDRVLAALAVREARDRQSAVPETILAGQTGLERDRVSACCDELVAAGHLKQVSWSDTTETLPGYYVDDVRVREQGLALYSASQ